MILAGGRASRMHNLDKGLQQLNRKTLVEHVIDRIQPQVSALTINANRNLEHYRQFGLPVWPDADLPESIGEHEFKGPLAGLETGLLHCKTDYLLIVPCDSPFVPTDLAYRLFSGLHDANVDIALTYTGTKAKPTLQPVFSLIKVSLLPQLKQYLGSGGRKMASWYGNAAAVNVFFPDESAFMNINTLAELRACSAENFKI